jgi:Glycosyltransferase family 87
MLRTERRYPRAVQLRARRAWVVAAAVALAAVLAVGAAKGAARVTDDPVVWALAGWQVPGDFGVFLAAGDAVLAGKSPYPAGELAPPPVAYYVYPPPLAFAVAPFTTLEPGHASTIWTLFGIAALVAGLLVLGVRDPRCHLVALLYPGTRVALEYGAIGTFLVLLVALAWRYRGRTVAAGATAGAVVLKVFLWPLLAWHVFAGRIQTALASTAAAAALALGTWAVIGFAGLTDYPRVLRDLTELEAEETYSVFALGRALGAPELGAQALAVLLGAVLLALAWRTARGGRDEGEQRTLILVLAAALVLTPILWIHYLVLLVVPVALARPHFSALWLLPLVGIAFEAAGWYGGWAYGDIPAVVSVLGVAAAVVAASLLSLEAPEGLRSLPARLRPRRPARASR